VKCFGFTPSIAVFGRNQLPATEELVPQPEDPCGTAKYAVALDGKSGARRGKPFGGIEVCGNLPRSWAAVEREAS